MVEDGSGRSSAHQRWDLKVNAYFAETGDESASSEGGAEAHRDIAQSVKLVRMRSSVKRGSNDLLECDLAQNFTQRPNVCPDALV